MIIADRPGGVCGASGPCRCYTPEPLNPLLTMLMAYTCGFHLLSCAPCALIYHKIKRQDHAFCDTEMFRTCDAETLKKAEHRTSDIDNTEPNAFKLQFQCGFAIAMKYSAHSNKTATASFRNQPWVATVLPFGCIRIQKQGY